MVTEVGAPDPVCDDDADVVRNKVSSTHEDTDAIFGVAKEHLQYKDCITPAMLKSELRKAFEMYTLPVVILDVDAVFDYKSFYEPHIDDQLAGYGCALLHFV